MNNEKNIIIEGEQTLRKKGTYSRLNLPEYG